MKKILSLVMVAVMMLSTVAMVSAAGQCSDCGEMGLTICPGCGENDYCSKCGNCNNIACDYKASSGSGSSEPAQGASSTPVTVQGTAAKAYTVTVPATLTANQKSGAVEVSGRWSAAETLTVTCPEKITLTRQGSTETIEVGVNLTEIAKAGNDSGTSTASGTVAIVVDESALFGTWIGQIDYTVTCE